MYRESPTQLALTVSPHVKGMPYFGGEREGSTNHGFKLLKGTQAKASSIPEAAEDAALSKLIDVLNASTSPFLSIGCEHSINEHDGKFWKRGYVEFALDSIEAAEDARNSFFYFYHFDQYLNKIKSKERVQFHWELEGNALMASNEGFISITSWITTAQFPTAVEAMEIWAKAADVLADFILQRSQPIEGTPLSLILTQHQDFGK